MAKNRGTNPGGRGNRTRIGSGWCREPSASLPVRPRPPAAGGPLVQTAAGREVESAWSRREARLTETAGRLLRAFGMTPASAAGLTTGWESGRRLDPTDPLGLG